MEIFGGILAAIIIAILISALFYYGLNARGPWGSLWTFFLVLLLIIWAASIWVRPVGPVYWGVSWVPLIFIGLLFALLLAAIPTEETVPEEEVREEGVVIEDPEIERRRGAAASAVAISWIFWLFIIILLIAIVAGISGYAA